MMLFRLDKTIKACALIALAFTLPACVGEEFDDLKTFIAQIKARPAKPIEPMPVIESYESYTYDSESLRDPFAKVDEPQPLSEVMAIDGPGPDLDRGKEELESYPLDTLRMVGTLSKNGQLWGLVRANDGVIHRVQSGNYLGQNFGKVIRVQNQQIDLAEWVISTTGKWRERDASLALAE
tara:strand:+ start:6979 stop:7518 length:540 start_codon:yes stop_codon:yes gene_type:complete